MRSLFTERQSVSTAMSELLSGCWPGPHGIAQRIGAPEIINDRRPAPRARPVKKGPLERLNAK